MRKGYVLTVKIILNAEVVESEAGVADYMSSLLSDTSDVIDWGYTKNEQGNFNYGKEIDIPEDYEEGDLI